MIKSIFILESSWDSDGALEHVSVQPIISEFAKQRNIKTYHKTFTDSKSLRHWVEKFDATCTSDALLYIAAHGNSKSIYGLNTRINFTTLVDIIKRTKNIKFLQFGSCLVGRQSNLELLMKKAKKLRWAAGYNKSIDWVDSAVFEILLWSRISPVGRQENEINLKTHTIVADILENEVKGLTAKFGFNFVYRYGTKIETISSE